MDNTTFYLAVAGWGAAVLVHCLALAEVDVASFAPYVWFLHAGIFAVWVPAIVKMRRAKARQQEGEEEAGRTGLSAVFKKAPRWLTVVAVAGMAYAPANFIFFRPLQSTDEEAGRYYTHIHGQHRQPITEGEYHRVQANVLRAFAGGWIAFYGMAMVFLYPFRKTEELEEPKVQEGV